MNNVDKKMTDLVILRRDLLGKQRHVLSPDDRVRTVRLYFRDHPLRIPCRVGTWFRV